MMMMKNLYWINGMQYGTLGNAYAIRHDTCLTLIDCGVAEDLDTLLSNLQYWGIGHLPVRHVLLTHGHRDHAGNAKALQDAGAKIYVHRLDAWQLESGGLTCETVPTPDGLDFSLPAIKPDILFFAGDILQIEKEQFRVIGAPGHTEGSVVFSWENEGRLLFFTGDTCSCSGDTGDEAILCWKADPGYSADRYIETLEKLRHYKPDAVLGGHGVPLLKNGERVLRSAAYKALQEYR